MSHSIKVQIRGRITRAHNSLLAVARALQYVYDDLPLENLAQFDADVIELIDMVLAAKDRAAKLREDVYKWTTSKNYK